MSTLEEATSVDTSKMVRMAPSTFERPPFMQYSEPGFSTIMRCPMPPIAVTPDSLRQFYQGDLFPQTRVLTPSPSSSRSSRTVTQTVVSVQGSSSSPGSSTGSVSTVSLPSTFSFTTPLIPVNAVFMGPMTISRSFDVLRVSASAACRVRLYSTEAAQNLDSDRPETAVIGGTEHEVIFDVVLDSDPFSWVMSPIAAGANGDDPISPTIYISVTNLAGIDEPINISLLYQES